ncbi:hypothetical protein P5673_011809, partial [Acropora cervicornis]
MEELSEEKDMDDDFSQISQLKSFPDLSDDDPYEQENVAEEPMVILSQETLSSQSEYEPSEDGLASQDEASLCEDQTEISSFGKQWVFLIYKQKLQELLPFCPKCCMLIEQESIQEVKNEGSQLSLRLNCLNNCNYKWQSQPPLQDIKGAGNLNFLVFSKFESLSKLINFKCIGKGTYYNLRERYVFPVVKTTWEEQQAEVFSGLKLKESAAVLAGDARCDSLGHCAKNCTYALLDVESQKVVDFKVVAVIEVVNSTCMEKKGFMDTLSDLEANDIKADIISTDRHPQIKNEIRVNHPNIDHQFDPWHISKYVTIVNQLWWCAESCGNDPEVLKEKWLSAIHHTTNRHEWPRNRHFHKCEYNRLSTDQQRKKKWLKPRSAFHTALVNIVNDKLLLKDIVHLTKFVQQPWKLSSKADFIHDVMTAGTMLAALDHNFNANRTQ